MYPNYGRSGRARLQNEIEHSGIFVRLLELDTTIATMTDSLGYFMFDSLPDGNWTLRASYAYYFAQQLPIKVIDGNLTRKIDIELEQIFQFWSEPAETTVSLQDNFCISPRISVVNLLSYTVRVISDEECEGNWGWIRADGWPSDSCFKAAWYFYNGVCSRGFERYFPPGDTFRFTYYNIICWADINSGECFEGEPVGTYLIFSGISDAKVFP